MKSIFPPPNKGYLNVKSILKQKIKQTILKILDDKRRDGDVLPYATSIEVAHLLHMNANEVEKLSEEIEGIVKGKTLNYEWYDKE